MTRHRWPAIATGLSGCLLLVVQGARAESGLPMIAAAGNDFYYSMPGSAAPFVIGPPLAAIVLSLLLLRWWPYQLLTAALVTGLWQTMPHEFNILFYIVSPVAGAFALIGVLACAQSLWRGGAPRWGAAMAALALGARVLGASFNDPLLRPGMITLAALALLAFAWRVRRADRENADPKSDKPLWTRVRTAVVAGVALFAIIPLSQVDRGDLADLLGGAPDELAGQRYILVALAGAATIVVAAVIAAFAGPWSLGGALTMAAAQAALATPLLLVDYALRPAPVAQLLGALAGVGIGVAVTVTRWPVAATGTLCVAAAASLFVADLATGGATQLIGDRHQVIPAVIILTLIVAAVTAVAGAVTPMLARRRSLPAVYGPLAGLIASGLVQVLDATYLEADGQPANDFLNAAKHLPTTGVLLLFTGAAVAGLGVARHLTERWDQRKRAEQIRLEAAEAERDRLARPIHDGVLQVLAMVQRDGADPRLAALAGEQDAALRDLLRDDDHRDH